MTSTRFWRVAFATALAFLCSVEAAHAGPLVAALGTAFTSISAAFQAVPLLGAAVSMAAQSLIAKLMAPGEPKQKGIKDKIQSGGDNPLSFIMGKRATAGKLVYVNQSYTADQPNNKLTLVISLSELPVTGLSNIIWINNEQCTIDFSIATNATTPDGDPNFDTDAPGPGFYRVVEYDKREKAHHQYCWVKFYDGTQTDPDEYLLDTFGDDDDKPWTDDMVGRGCAYAIVVCRYSRGGAWSGIPEFKFVVEGIPNYDMTKDSSMGGSGPQRWDIPSTWEFSENPKVLIYNILMGIRYNPDPDHNNGDWIYGGQDVSQYQLPASYWLAAIAHCNETVHKDATDEDLARYTASCEITVDQQPIDIIKELDKTCAGYTAEFGGKWKTFVGPPGTSVFSITDADVLNTEEQTDELFKSDTTYNGVRATYTKPQEGWASKECAPLILDDLLAEDDQLQQIAELQLPFVTESNQVQRLMRLLVKDSRRQITHNVQLPPAAMILEPFDVLSWTSKRNGYTNKKFQVSRNEDLPNCNQQIMLREVDPSDYDWDTAFELPDTVGPISPVRAGSLALEFTVSPSQIDRPGGGKDKPAILVEWDWGLPDIDLKWVKWEVRKSSGEPDVIAHGIFNNTEDTDRKITHSTFRFKHSYQVRLLAEPERPWRDGTWTAWKSVTMVDIDIPGAPTLTRVSDLADDGNLDFYIDIDWTKVNADVKYELKIDNGSRTVTRHAGEDNAYRLPVTSGKTYTVWVRAVAEDGGTVGDWSSSTSITVTKKNTAPTAPTSLTLQADFHKLILAWNKSPDKDRFGVNIYRSNTNDFTAASLVHQTTATGWTDEGLGVHVTKYYWITFVDRTGNESSKYPASNTAGVNGTTVSINDGDTDDTGPNPPTSLAVSSRTDLNGDGKVDVELVVTFTGIANAKAAYIIRVEDVAAGTFTQYPVKDQGSGTPTAHRKTIPAISGKAYNVSVASVSGTGAQGSYTSNVNLTAVRKTAAPTAPTSLGVVASHKRVLVKANKSPDSDFAKLIVYSSATNDFTTATEVGRNDATHFIDDGLANGATRYYWITFLDRSQNESAKYPASNTAGIVATVPRIGDDDTDPTAIASPTGLTLSQVTKRDKDGQIKTYVKMNCTPPLGVSAKASYSYRVDNGTDPIFTVKSDDVDARFPAEVGVTYAVQVRAIAFNNVKGTLTSAVNITPVKKVNDLPAPSGLAIASNAKRNKIDWTDIDDDTYPDYRNTCVWRNTTGTTPTPGVTATAKRTKSGYFVDDNLTIGTIYYYWISHRDNSGNFSALAGPVSSAATGVGIAELPTETSQLVLNPSFEGASSDGWSLSSLASVVAKGAAGVPANARSAYVIQVAGQAGGNQDNYWSSFVPVEPGEIYYVEAVIEADASLTHSLSIGMNFKDGSLSGNNWITGITKTAADGMALTGWTKVSGLLTVPATASGNPTGYGRFWFSINLNASPTGKWYLSKMRCRKATDSDIIAVNAVGNTHIQDNAVTDAKVGGQLDYQKVKTVGDGNFFRNPAFDNGSVSGWFLYGNGVVVARASATVAGAPSRFVGKFTGNSAFGEFFAGSPIDSFEVSAGETFAARLFAAADAITGSGNIALAGRFFNASNDGVAAYVSIGASLTALDAAGTWQETKGLITVPATVNGLPTAIMQCYVEIPNTITGGSVYFAKPRLRRATDNDMLGLGAVLDANTDQTAPGTPTVTINTFTADIDGDGSLDAALSLAIVNPNTGVSIKRYVVEIYRSATLGGTYTIWKRESVEAEDAADTLTTTWTFKANKNKFHKVKVRAVSTFGKKGSFSTLTTTGVQPTTVSGYNGVTGASPTVSPVANAMKVSWALTDNSANPLDTTIYKETEILVGAVSLTKIKGTSYTDTTARTAGTSYTYTLKHYDIHGNVTTVSAGTSATYRQAQTADIGTGQVTDDRTDQTAPGTPGVPSVSTINVDFDGDGTLDTGLTFSWTVPGSGVPVKFYNLEVWRSSTIGGTYTLWQQFEPKKTTKTIKANARFFHKARVQAVSFNGTEGSFSSLTTTGVAPLANTAAPTAPSGAAAAGFVPLSVNANWNTNTDPDYLCTEIFLGVSTPPSVSQVPTYVAVQGNPALATQFFRAYFGQGGASPRVWIRHVNRSGQKSAWVDAGTASIALLTGNEIDTLTVTNANIALNTISANRLSNVYDVFQQGSALTTLGDVGTYAFLKNGTGGTLAGGATAAGSSLTYNDTGLSGSTAASGTWKALGRVVNGQATMFLRIS